MAVFLSFLICAFTGADCRVVLLVDRSFIGLAACQQAGMFMLPDWQERHPGWLVKKIRCTMGTPPKGELMT